MKVDFANGRVHLALNRKQRRLRPKRESGLGSVVQRRLCTEGDVHLAGSRVACPLPSTARPADQVLAAVRRLSRLLLLRRAARLATLSLRRGGRRVGELRRAARLSGRGGRREARLSTLVKRLDHLRAVRSIRHVERRRVGVARPRSRAPADSAAPVTSESGHLLVGRVSSGRRARAPPARLSGRALLRRRGRVGVAVERGNSVRRVGLRIRREWKRPRDVRRSRQPRARQRHRTRRRQP